MFLRFCVMSQDPQGPASRPCLKFQAISSSLKVWPAPRKCVGGAILWKTHGYIRPAEIINLELMLVWVQMIDERSSWPGIRCLGSSLLTTKIWMLCSR